jgi:hypothetical protein
MKKMKKTTKIKAAIFAVSSIVTYFIFHAARASAIAERGTSNAIGGEILLLLIPILAILFYDNIVLTAKVFKPKANESNNATIRIEKINSIEVQEK